MTIQDQIVVLLAEHPERVDDDQIAAALGVLRQQVNQRCRRLELFGKLTRRSVDGKIRNFVNGVAPFAQGMVVRPEVALTERPRFWEGNVQSAVVDYLSARNYRIVSVADTASRQQGKDIVAVAPSNDTLWVSAKGYPAGTERTNPRTQARHWFAHALFDLILWHGDDASKALALALPDRTTYRSLARRAGWFLASLDACVYWVAEGGSVTPEKF